MTTFKHYQGRIAACGVYCGGCPVYTRDKKPCPGAEINSQRCDGCKTFHLCCKARGITHCYACDEFPCKKFKDFSRRWQKYGQDFIKNQKMLKEKGPSGFLDYYHSKGDKE